MNNSMKTDNIQAMKNQKKSQILYNFILYSLTTLISCSFICYPFWFPSMNYLFSVSLQNIFSFFFTAKFLFVVGSIIVIILVKESIQAGSYSSPATEIYDEYIAQISRREPSRSNYIHAKKKKEEKMDTEDKQFPAENKKVKLCSEAVEKERREKEQVKIIPTDDLNRRVEARQAGSNSSPATEIYDEYLAPANEKVHEDKMENTEDKRLRAEKKKQVKIYRGIVKREEREKEEENSIPTEELNRRVEAYIARVNRQRLHEAKSLVCSRRRA